MSHTIKTLADGDILRKALPILHNKLVFCKTINHYYEDKFAQTGHKNGGAILIREPNQFTVRTGAVMDTQDVTESTKTLTVATQYGIDVNFSSYERTMSMDDFSERILEPAITRLAAQVDAAAIAAMYPYIFNWTITTSGTKPVLADVLAARAKLAQGLAPTGDRTAMVNALAGNSIITDGKSLFHAASEIERQYRQGLMGEMGGFKFYETEMVPTHTNGTRTDTTPTTSTATFSAAACSSITIAANASSTTYTAGDVFTIDGVYAVNPETKAVYPHLQQFSCVTAFVSATTSSGTIAISPTVYASGAKQNISVVTSSATAALNNLDNGGTGAASYASSHCLMYHKDAFTMASVDLMLPPGGQASRKVMDGISMRIWTQGDIVNDKVPTRIDVLVGFAATRPEWACRMVG